MTELRTPPVGLHTPLSRPLNPQLTCACFPEALFRIDPGMKKKNEMKDEKIKEWGKVLLANKTWCKNQTAHSRIMGRGDRKYVAKGKPNKCTCPDSVRLSPKIVTYKCSSVGGYMFGAVFACSGDKTQQRMTLKKNTKHPGPSVNETISRKLFNENFSRRDRSTHNHLKIPPPACEHLCSQDIVNEVASVLSEDVALLPQPAPWRGALLTGTDAPFHFKLTVCLLTI